MIESDKEKTGGIKLIKHIVFFNFKDEALGKTKKENMEKVKKDLEALADIEQIKALEVGIDINGSERAYDLSLYTEFETMADLDFYQDYGPHVDIKHFVREVCIGTAVVDYEV